MTHNRPHLYALLATLLFHMAVVVILVSLYLRYSPAEDSNRTWPPVDSAEILFGGEYVMLGDRPELAPNTDAPAPAETDSPEPPAPEVEALENTGTPAPQPSPVVSSQRPSPAKVIKKEKPAHPTGPSKAEREAAERAKKQQEARQAIANRVKFGSKGTGDKGSGKAGSPDGNSNSGAVSGTPGFNLRGRSLDSWHTPAKGPLGTVTIRVAVNREGKVTSATYSSGTGAAAASESVRINCVNAARASRFSVNMDAPVSQTGTITYRFE